MSIRDTLWNGILRKLPEMDLTRNTYHGKMSFSNKDQVIAYNLFHYGAFEYNKIVGTIEILRAIGLLKEKNGILLDVGANIGTVCIPMVTKGFFVRAVAFEPDRTNFRLLQKNISQNDLSGPAERPRSSYRW